MKDLISTKQPNWLVYLFIEAILQYLVNHADAIFLHVKEFLLGMFYFYYNSSVHLAFFLTILIFGVLPVLLFLLPPMIQPHKYGSLREYLGEKIF